MGSDQLSLKQPALSQTGRYAQEVIPARTGLLFSKEATQNQPLISCLPLIVILTRDSTYFLPMI
jgi:hypothetical protein